MAISVSSVNIKITLSAEIENLKDVEIYMKSSHFITMEIMEFLMKHMLIQCRVVIFVTFRQAESQCDLLLLCIYNVYMIFKVISLPVK
jgi:hypothetical protein